MFPSQHHRHIVPRIHSRCSFILCTSSKHSRSTTAGLHTAPVPRLHHIWHSCSTPVALQKCRHFAPAGHGIEGRTKNLALLLSLFCAYCERSEFLVYAASAKILPASDSEHRPRRGGVRLAYRDPSGER